MKILILGGYGTFGGRLAHLLAGEERLTLIVAGRSKSRAEAFSTLLPPGAKKVPLAFDRDADVAGQIGAARPDLVVDATGPFQFYGDNPYRVVKACVSQGVHYMDLADGAQFVEGIGQFDEEAKARKLYVLSGVSSFPVLTAAVVRHLARDLSQVTDIRGGIAPSPYAGVGLNVIRAIAGYAGKPVPLIRGEHAVTGYALTDSVHYTISPPGYVPLTSTRFSLVDVPDLQILPRLWPGLNSIWMGAGPVPAILHRMLSGLAWLVRLRLLPSLSPFARLFHWVTNVLRWGEHRGGMFVSVRGNRRNGETVERSWHLVAEGDDGPYIPSMAIEAIVRRSLAGMAPQPGARPCVDDLELDDYALLFKNRKIRTGERESSPTAVHQSAYRDLLGTAWNLLPEPVQAMHGRAANLESQGIAHVERGNGWLAALAAAAFGFPEASDRVPVSVSFQSHGDGERWHRTFGRSSFSSFQARGRGRSEGLLREKFGPFAFHMALVVDGEKLRFVVRNWSFLGLPLPANLAPTGNSYEFAENGRFHFHVEIAHPLTGLIVRYSGWLTPTADRPVVPNSSPGQ
jgi:NAD(P)-dependent dehydrogenase (short-subunit alcohol dehydrogenase family)